MTAADVRSWSVDNPVRDQYLVFGRPQLLDAEIEEIVATLRSGWIGTGPRVAQFQRDFEAYSRAKHAVAVSSCTAALHLAMIAIGIQPGDEVIVPSMTFAATANTVIHAGGRPVLADVCRDTMCLDPEDTARRITPRTKAIIPVHFAGRCCEMNALMTLASKHDLIVIEDCAHAIETLHGDRHAGTIGDIGAFSFYVTKNVVTGEGGMVTTANQAWADRIRTLALHGMSADAWKRFSDAGFKQYDVVEPGYKYNLTDMQAALGIHQLARVEENLLRRREIWGRYDAAFADLPMFVPSPEETGTRHARHLYTALIDIERMTVGRDDIQLALHRQGIGTGIHYRALHLSRYYSEKFGYEPRDFPVAEWISERTLSLPLSPALSDEDVDDVIFATRRTMQYLAK